MSNTKQWKLYHLEEAQLREAYNRGDFNYGEFKNRLALIRSKKESCLTLNKQKESTVDIVVTAESDNVSFTSTRADELKAGDKVMLNGGTGITEVREVSPAYWLSDTQLAVDIRFVKDERNFIYSADKTFLKLNTLEEAASKC